MAKPNFKRAKEEAYKTLMLQENFSFPINPKNIKLIDLPKYKVTFVNGDTVDFSQSAYKRMKRLFDKQ